MHSVIIKVHQIKLSQIFGALVGLFSSWSETFNKISVDKNENIWKSMSGDWHQ